MPEVRDICICPEIEKGLKIFYPCIFSTGRKDFGPSSRSNPDGHHEFSSTLLNYIDIKVLSVI